jgi:hypothetical protein
MADDPLAVQRGPRDKIIRFLHRIHGFVMSPATQTLETSTKATRR